MAGNGRVAPFVYDSVIVNQGTEMAEYFAVMGLNSIRLVAVSKTDRMMNTQPFIELRNHIRHEVGSRVRNDVVVQTEGAKIGEQRLCGGEGGYRAVYLVKRSKTTRQLVLPASSAGVMVTRSMPTRVR